MKGTQLNIPKTISGATDKKMRRQLIEKNLRKREPLYAPGMLCTPPFASRNVLVYTTQKNFHNVYIN